MNIIIKIMYLLIIGKNNIYLKIKIIKLQNISANKINNNNNIASLLSIIKFSILSIILDLNLFLIFDLQILQVSK